jgi:hypothetical protein
MAITLRKIFSLHHERNPVPRPKSLKCSIITLEIFINLIKEFSQLKNFCREEGTPRNIFQPNPNCRNPQHLYGKKCHFPTCPSVCPFASEIKVYPLPIPSHSQEDS